MNPQSHDFRKPLLPTALRNLLAGWGPKVCSQACRLWGAQLPFTVQMESCEGQVMPAARALDNLPDTALRFRVLVESGPDVSLLAASRPMLLAILAGVFGSPIDPENLDQELTPVEEDVVEFVAEQYFLGPLQRAWPRDEKLRLEPPRRLSPTAELPFARSARLLVTQYKVKAPFGEFDWWWMVPHDGALLSSLGGGPAPVPSSHEERESTIKELPVRMTVQLGSAPLSLLHLACLQEGDLLLLDQPIDQPLPALLGGQVKFLVWPGARGGRQAVRIHGTCES